MRFLKTARSGRALTAYWIQTFAEPYNLREYMQKNDLFELKITDIGVDGEGIGKYEGMTFFVKDACIGDVIRARVIKLKKNVERCGY